MSGSHQKAEDIITDACLGTEGLNVDKGFSESVRISRVYIHICFGFGRMSLNMMANYLSEVSAA